MNMNFSQNSNRTIITEMVTVLVQKNDNFSKKSFCEPYPPIWVGVNGGKSSIRKISIHCIYLLKVDDAREFSAKSW